MCVVVIVWTQIWRKVYLTNFVLISIKLVLGQNRFKWNFIDSQTPFLIHVLAFNAQNQVATPFWSPTSFDIRIMEIGSRVETGQHLDANYYMPINALIKESWKSVQGLRLGSVQKEGVFQTFWTPIYVLVLIFKRYLDTKLSFDYNSQS